MSSRPRPASSCNRRTWNRSGTSPPMRSLAATAELAEWAEFCAGPEAYVWWQAGPWSGKSALASWFVTHPPAGVDVVSFFITGRLAGQADSDAFLDAMIEQLNALGPVGVQSPPAAGARVGIWLRLLADAAAQAEERARRLVVVVDGLDEDEAGASPPRGRPSIASLLPRRPPPGVRFIITSRPDPGVPDDVPSGHPLRTCIPRHLPVSWVAEDVERLRQAGTAGPARRRSDRHRCGRLCRRVWRWPYQERLVGAHRGSPARARLSAARGVRPQPSDPRIRVFP